MTPSPRGTVRRVQFPRRRRLKATIGSMTTTTETEDLLGLVELLLLPLLLRAQGVRNLQDRPLCVARATYKKETLARDFFRDRERESEITLTTSSGKFASCATWIPKLWSHTPRATLYRSVISLPVSDAGFDSTCATTCKFSTCLTVCASCVSSWKCVANKTEARVTVERCLVGQ